MVLKSVSGKNFIYEISKKSDVTYSHVYKLIFRLEKMGLVFISKTANRKRFVSLTVKGKQVVELYYKINNILKGDS
ncbi:winged helix DNA-binding protein [Candidatus Bathyarchaeota archaeon]|nr:winged helix DNA-binding protein [Candidatus Bathyarchaeota archaeon]